MPQPLFPSTIGTQSRSAKFLTMKTVVRKTQENDSHTQTHVLCGCTTFGTELKLGTQINTYGPYAYCSWDKGVAVTKGGGVQ